MLIPARLSIGRFPRFGDWLGHLNKIWEQWQKCLRNSDLSCWNVENGLAASLYLSMRCLRKRLLTSCLFLRHTPYCIFHRKRLRDSHVNDPLILEAPLGKLADGSGWQNNKFCICDGSILWSLVGELCGREVCFTLVYPSGFCHGYKTPGFFFPLKTCLVSWSEQRILIWRCRILEATRSFGWKVRINVVLVGVVCDLVKTTSVQVVADTKLENEFRVTASKEEVLAEQLAGK